MINLLKKLMTNNHSRYHQLIKNNIFYFNHHCHVYKIGESSKFK